MKNLIQNYKTSLKFTLIKNAKMEKFKDFMS